MVKDGRLSHLMKEHSKDGCSHCSQYLLEIRASLIRQEKNKKHNISEGKNKIIFADNTISYVKNPKNTTEKILELVHKFS